MSRAVLSIGSNVGDSLAHLNSVTEALGDGVDAVSALYSSAPWGGVEQQDFLNAVIVVNDPARDAYGWLEFARECEVAADRVRIERWGPRSLDVDIIVCGNTVSGNIVSDDPELLLPHPRAHQRAFVLVPWLDVEPDAELTVGGVVLPIEEWLARLSSEERDGVRRADVTLDTLRRLR